MPLTESKIKQASPKPKPYRIADEYGLCLLVQPDGARYWRLRWTKPDGRESGMSLGVWPDVSLSEARSLRDKHRQEIRNGADPLAARKAARTPSVLWRDVVADWSAITFPQLTPGTLEAVHGQLKGLQRLDNVPIAAITAPLVLELVTRIDKSGKTVRAHRTLTRASQILDYAVARALIPYNPIPKTAHKALRVHKTRHHPAITDPKGFGELLRAIEGRCSGQTKAALQLLPLLFPRPQELSQAEWCEFDLDNALWTIPKEHVKTRHSRLVPLPGRAVDILRRLKASQDIPSKYLFPNKWNIAKPMHRGTLPSALRDLGYHGKQDAHGFRASARTLLDEQIGYRIDYIELQLGHTVRDPLGRAYNRASFLDERRNMLEAWADYLATLKRDQSLAIS